MNIRFRRPYDDEDARRRHRTLWYYAIALMLAAAYFVWKMYLTLSF